MRDPRRYFLIGIALFLVVIAYDIRRAHGQANPGPAPQSYDPCMHEFHRSFPVSQSGTTTTFAVAGDPNLVGPIVICAQNVVVGASATYQLIGGTGTNCGTQTVQVTGAYGASTLLNDGTATVANVPSGDDLCIKTTGSNGAAGVVSYVRYIGKFVPSSTPTFTATPSPTPT